MNTQFITDDSGNKVAVVMSIKEYERLTVGDVPEWQKVEVRQRLKDHEANPNDYLDFDVMMDEIEKEL